MSRKNAVILHGPDAKGLSADVVRETLDSVLAMNNRDFELILMGQAEKSVTALLENSGQDFTFVKPTSNVLSIQLNEALTSTDSDFILYIDNAQNPIRMKKAGLDVFSMAAERHENAAYIYADYDLKDGESVKEIKLLFHHRGRVRDNQDYGKVHYFRRSALTGAGNFDSSVRFNALYDIRLKLSEGSELIRVSNKYNGSLYTVVSGGKKANVFDYLLAGKEVQVEAEEVVTRHLKRLGAYLAPGQFRKSSRKNEDGSELKASVIIPVGYRPEFIGTAINSIQAQTVQDIEAIIVVNGGDEDPTIPEVKRYMKGGDLHDASKPEIRLIVVDVNSIGFCLNLGARAAKGKYYIQLDSDDRLKADAVQKAIDVFESDSKIGMVIGSYEVWEKHEDGRLTRMEEIPVVTHDEWTEDNGRNNLLRINGAGAPRCIPIAVIEEMGGFSINDDAYARNYGEDYEMVNKISESYRIGRIYDPIYEVIRHSGGTDHAISQDVIDRNDEAKDDMRREAIARRIALNGGNE